MKIKIAKAMKWISRLKGEIKILDDRIRKCISCPESNGFIEDFEKLKHVRDTKVIELIDLKNKVMTANINNNKFYLIAALSELKNEIVLYKDLEIKQGLYKERYDVGGGVMFKTQITVEEKENHIEEVQNRIIELTDELDIFNASTDIEV